MVAATQRVGKPDTDGPTEGPKLWRYQSGGRWDPVPLPSDWTGGVSDDWHREGDWEIDDFSRVSVEIYAHRNGSSRIAELCILDCFHSVLVLDLPAFLELLANLILPLCRLDGEIDRLQRENEAARRRKR
jgi:hypothetical protein